MQQPGDAKDSLLMTSLKEFYATATHAHVARDFLTVKETTSLRTIDWFVTTYSRRNSVIILLDDGRVIDLHASYKSQLKSFSKKRFDVFKRGKTVSFELDDTTVQTTLPQLNFFRWLIRFKVADYIKSHAKDIDRAMKAYFQEKDDGDGSVEKKKKKRRVCSASSIVARVVFD